MTDSAKYRVFSVYKGTALLIATVFKCNECQLVPSPGIITINKDNIGGGFPLMFMIPNSLSYRKTKSSMS